MFYTYFFFFTPFFFSINTSKKEIMEITSGELHVCLANSSDWITYLDDSSFEVPANSSFKVKVKKITNYCCSYVD